MFSGKIVEALVGAITDIRILVVLGVCTAGYWVVRGKLPDDWRRAVADVIFVTLMLYVSGANGRFQERRDLESKLKDIEWVLLKQGPPLRIDDETEIRLTEVASFDGWAEREVDSKGTRVTYDVGRVDLSARKPGAEQIFKALKPKLGLDPTSPSLKEMTQDDWARLVSGQKDKGYLGAVSWCVFRLSGATQDLPPMRARDEMTVKVGDKTLGRLQVINVYNMQNSRLGSTETCTVKFTPAKRRYGVKFFDDAS